MKKTRPLHFTLVALLALTLPAGCSGGDDDDDDDDGAIVEIEPNDVLEDATILGSAGTYAFSGSCDQDFDIFRAEAGLGAITASLAWDDSAGFDIDLRLDYIDDSVVPPSAGETIAEDDTSPPGDSPATATGTVNTGGGVSIFINCLSVGSGAYEGTVTVP